MSANGVEALVTEREVVICCGSGGVGKTTISAVIALEAARRGRRAVVVTIDPAKRLANALGLSSLSDSPTEIHRGHWDPDASAAPAGRLFALMLDTKSTFDRLVARYAGSAEQADRIYENRFYQNLASALSGTQEYMAMEKLHELASEGRYDVIVVDTPPTRHALDFLDAPQRLLRLLEHPAFRLVMAPTRAGMKATGFALRTMLKTIARVVGSDVIEDAVAFFHAFEGMEEGFRERARAVGTLIADEGTSFALVTSPRRDSLAEARYFTERLAQSDLWVEALVVNRVHPSFTSIAPKELRRDAQRLSDWPGDGNTKEAARRLSALHDNLADFAAATARERSHLDELAGLISPDAVVLVPYLVRDVHDFDALAELGAAIFGPRAHATDA